MTSEEEFALQLRAAKIAFVREHRFHPERKWRFDFAVPDLRVAIEIEGGTWIAGRHTTGSGFAKDCAKYNAATLLGWRVLRFTTDMVRTGEAFGFTREMLAIA
jgi:very-short-patch-repair endonuclease